MKHWFVLNYIRRPGQVSPQRDIDYFNRDGQRVELFAPIIRPAEVVNGKVVFRERLLTFFYVFVRGTLDDIKALCAIPSNGLSFMLDRGSDRRYGIISDQAMESFKVIARMHANSIPFYALDDIQLQEGDLVEVVDGDYAGLRGTFMPRARSNKGNLVIAATASLGTIVWNVDAKYVRILEFAPASRRPYDIVDSFVGRLYPILRKYHGGQPLSESERSQLVVFNRRMGAVRPANPKLEAKLLAILLAVQTILGDTAAVGATRSRLDKRLPGVTNPWTRALIDLLLHVALGTPLPAPPARPAPQATTAQRLLLAEYDYYSH